MWSRMKYSLYRFMSGRYGTDELNKFLMILYFALWAVDLFINFLPLSLLWMFVMITLLFRTFSKNHVARSRENRGYLKIKRGFVGFFSFQKTKFKDRKTHVFRTCPHCKANIRLPRSKGKHTVRCPKCQNRFDVKIG